MSERENHFGADYSEFQIRRDGEESERETFFDELPVFNTPLPESKGFGYWSKRFQARKEVFDEAAEVKTNHVSITLPGTCLINFIGDIHTGSPYTDYRRVEREIETIIETPRSYVMLMGDLVDGF